MEKKERFSYIFSICGLILIIGFLIFLYTSGFLFASQKSEMSSIPIGSNTTLIVKNSNSAVASFELSGSVLPGEKIRQNISIKNDGLQDLKVRARAFIKTLDEGEIEVYMNVSEKWQKDGDYYYYTEPVLSKSTIGLTGKIMLNEDYVLSGNQRYIINILVESLSIDVDADSLWV